MHSAVTACLAETLREIISRHSFLPVTSPLQLYGLFLADSIQISLYCLQVQWGIIFGLAKQHEEILLHVVIGLV